MNKKYIAILLMIFNAVCLCMGQLVWKLMPDYHLIYLLGGFTIYVIGAAILIFAYRLGEISTLQPINSISFVFSTFIGVYFLNEILKPVNIIGVLFIISGVIVIGISSK